MPCGCFGGGKKNKERLLEKSPPSPPLGQSTPEVKGQDDRTAKRRDVVASYYGDECALLGYKSTGSRPPSSYVDSPNSHTHTPSTAPIDASHSSQNSSLTSSPRSSRQGAICRAQLAEKRREFFRDFVPSDYRNSPLTLSSTLPTTARARQFGKVRNSTRPLSDPTGDQEQNEISKPPGPHLLHPSPNNPKPPKIVDTETLASEEFILELKNASDKISQRWASGLSEDDEQNFDCTSPASLPITLKMRPPNSPPPSEEDELPSPIDAPITNEAFTRKSYSSQSSSSESLQDNAPDSRLEEIETRSNSSKESEDILQLNVGENQIESVVCPIEEEFEYDQVIKNINNEISPIKEEEEECDLDTKSEEDMQRLLQSDDQFNEVVIEEELEEDDKESQPENTPLLQDEQNYSFEIEEDKVNDSSSSEDEKDEKIIDAPSLIVGEAVIEPLILMVEDEAVIEPPSLIVEDEAVIEPPRVLIENESRHVQFEVEEMHDVQSSEGEEEKIDIIQSYEIEEQSSHNVEIVLINVQNSVIEEEVEDVQNYEVEEQLLEANVQRYGIEQVNDMQSSDIDEENNMEKQSIQIDEEFLDKQRNLVEKVEETDFQQVYSTRDSSDEEFSDQQKNLAEKVEETDFQQVYSTRDSSDEEFSDQQKNLAEKVEETDFQQVEETDFQQVDSTKDSASDSEREGHHEEILLEKDVEQSSEKYDFVEHSQELTDEHVPIKDDSSVASEDERHSGISDEEMNVVSEDSTKVREHSPVELTEQVNSDGEELTDNILHQKNYEVESESITNDDNSNRIDVHAPSETKCTTDITAEIQDSSASSVKLKIDSNEVVTLHDDGLGSEIEEGIDDHNNVQQQHAT